MNWEETVLKETKKRVEVPSVLGGYASPIVGTVNVEPELLAQAKITWDKRTELAKKEVQAHGNICYNAGKQEGRQEVVDWVEVNLLPVAHNKIEVSRRKWECSPNCERCMWQSQLKAWGVKEKK